MEYSFDRTGTKPSATAPSCCIMGSQLKDFKTSRSSTFFARIRNPPSHGKSESYLRDLVAFAASKSNTCHCPEGQARLSTRNLHPRHTGRCSGCKMAVPSQIALGSQPRRRFFYRAPQQESPLYVGGRSEVCISRGSYICVSLIFLNIPLPLRMFVIVPSFVTRIAVMGVERWPPLKPAGRVPPSRASWQHGIYVIVFSFQLAPL